MGSTCAGLISVRAACRRRSVSISSATLVGEALADEPFSPGDPCDDFPCSGLDLLLSFPSRDPTGLERGCEAPADRPAELGRGPL